MFKLGPNRSFIEDIISICGPQVEVRQKDGEANVIIVGIPLFIASETDILYKSISGCREDVIWLISVTSLKVKFSNGLGFVPTAGEELVLLTKKLVTPKTSLLVDDPSAWMVHSPEVSKFTSGQH